jgi:DNA-directed RNA polymerase specialized sigma24 family protein
MSAHNESHYSSAESKATSDAADAVRKAFAALPFEQKVATLMRVELDMLGDVVETVVNAASRAADEIADALSGSSQPASGSGATSV